MSVVGKKDDSGKPPVGQGGFLYFPRAIAALSLNSQYGKKKYDTVYSERNFLQVEGGVGRYTDGMFRHLAGEVTDEGGIDPETGLPHMYAAAWNALARLECKLEEEAKLAKEIEDKDKVYNEEKQRIRSLTEQLRFDLQMKG